MTNSQDDTTTWIGGDGAWTDAASWSDGVPTDTEVAAFAADTTENVQGDGVAGQVAVAGAVSLSGAVSVSGALSLSGTGTLTLGATAMVQAAGAVSVYTTARLTNHGTLETTASVIHGTVIDDGLWSVDGALEISGGVVIAEAGGRIETTGGVRVDGRGTVELGPTTFVSGGFTLDDGTLSVGPGSGSGTADAPATVTIGRPLVLEGGSDSLSLQASDMLVINGSITGSVSDGLKLVGSGAVVLNGNNSFSGGVVIGTHAELLMNSATAVGTGSISFAAGTPDPNKPLATPVGGVPSSESRVEGRGARGPGKASASHAARSGVDAVRQPTIGWYRCDAVVWAPRSGAFPDRCLIGELMPSHLNRIDRSVEAPRR